MYCTVFFFYIVIIKTNIINFYRITLTTNAALVENGTDEVIELTLNVSSM